MANGLAIQNRWSTRLAFILAASGSAVGLGNIWRFPYTAGEYGGGAFVLVYLLCIAAIGIPIMAAEIMLGKRGRCSPIGSLAKLTHSERASSAWISIGWLGMLTGTLILSFYSVIGGWTLDYSLGAATGRLVGIDAATAQARFADLVADPYRLLISHSVFMGLVMIVVARGVSQGLEQAIRWLMPILFVLLVFLILFAAQTGDFLAGLRYLLEPNFAAFENRAGEAVLSAMGQAFFSLSLGMGAIMVYGAYLKDETSIGHSAVLIAAVDTLVALLAGMVVFPIVFANGLEPAAGPGLIFETLPIAFGQLPASQLFATLFFVLLTIAAWTSAISVLEPAVAWVIETRGWSRLRATLVAGLGIWTLGVACLLSLNEWSGFKVFGKGILDLLDFLTANIMLPLGGLLIAVFAGWIMSRSTSEEELGRHHPLGYRAWWVLARYVAPVGVGIVFVHAIGLI
jgi:NSS family neurotransmitter:Na+ symporter